MTLLASASAEPSAVFDMMADGGAVMRVDETVTVDFPEGSVLISADESNLIGISGSINDDLLAEEDDFVFATSLHGSEGILDFEMSGDQTYIALGIYGEFEVEVSAKEVDDGLELEVSGSMDKDVFESFALTDLDTVGNDTEKLRLGLQEGLNSVIGDLAALPTKPSLVINDLELSGVFIIDFSMSATVEGWEEFAAAMAALGYSQAPETSDMLGCLGFEIEELTTFFLEPGLDVEAKIAGSDGTISAHIGATSDQPKAQGGVHLESIDFDISKSGREITLEGTIGVTDAQRLIGCIMENYMPGEYDTNSFDYVMSKSSSSDKASQEFECRLSGLAEKSGEEWIVAVPREMTIDTDVRVNVPSGMAVSSVSGGEQEGEGAAVSNLGEEFIVIYGPKGAAGLDMTQLLMIAIAIIIILALLSRRRGGERRARR